MRLNLALPGREWVENSPILAWPLDLDTSDEQSHRAAYVALAPMEVEHRSDVRMVLPAIGASDAPALFGLWWALLLALSSLVRYEPAAWVAAIDPERSQLTVPLERVCDYAQWLVPSILNQWLQGMASPD